jgi:hypothetical protein
MVNVLSISEESLVQSIYLLHGTKVMLDFDLATLYGLETRSLKQQVKRNLDRFPQDFMFQLTKAEWNELITNCDKLPQKIRHYPIPPLAFTEQGVAMLSSVLRSKRAIMVNIAIMRTFVQLRQLVEANKELVRRIDTLEERFDKNFTIVFEAIKELIREENQPREKIGFKIGTSSNKE